MTHDNYDHIVCVGFPTAIPGLFDYHVPTRFRESIYPGVAVRVSIRNREAWGVVIRVKNDSDIAQLNDIKDVYAHGTRHDMQALVALYEWIASYYKCAIHTVFKPFVRKKLIETAPRRLTEYQIITPPHAPAAMTKTQYNAATHLHAEFGSSWFSAKQAYQRCNVTRHILAALAEKEVVRQKKVAITSSGESICMDEDAISLSETQKNIVDTITEDFSRPDTPFLLHGITGSGKTFIYIELTKRMLARNKSVIILVPEISLTPQTIQRFEAALGEETVALIHSRMAAGERKETLQKVMTGSRRVLVGARSAVLAPMHDPGLIIVDEEHDASYKQTETPPRYNARDVAVMRGRYQHCTVVLGSATPSIESYYNALRHKYRLCELHERFAGAVLPAVEIVDMNNEHKENNWTILSRPLAAKIEEVLAQGTQAILLLNRRGFSVCLICKSCGHTHTCPHCCVTLTYHRSDLTLKCHQCGYFTTAPDTCPECHGTHIKYKGTGIQKAAEYIQQQFPHARLLRMDQDSTRRKGAFSSILSRFARREADILIGTQMVAKGLDFPGVRLVGVLQADTALHIPDFRAAERTFHLLTQVSGRAGRKDNAGTVVIQTYYPEEYAITYAQQHDFVNFYRMELQQRKELGYPPYGRLIRIVAESTDGARAFSLLQRIASDMHTHKTAEDVFRILGPSPAVLERLRGKQRYSLLVKSDSPAQLHRIVKSGYATGPVADSQVKITIDVDPVNML